MATIRIPTRFYVDRMDRGCCNPQDYSTAKTYCAVRDDDPNLWKLLSDAEWYAAVCSPDNCPRGIINSAAATVRAIRDVIGWEDAKAEVLRLRRDK